ncbi:MAG: response regulator, partial [Desulfobacula sp.]|nr:response regulator [Desulfobacula sp.]
MVVDPNMKILVVDDSGTMRVMFKQMLNKAGFDNIIIAANGKEGLEKVKKEKPDLILSDWNMPVMDGLEFLKELRKTDEYKNLPFIMATAQSDKTSQNQILDAGGNGHVPKPFDENQIKKAIEKIFAPKGKGDDQPKKKKRQVIGGRVELNVAHIQITDHLALGVLKYRIDQGEIEPEHFDLTTSLKPGWNPIQEGLENGELDCAFVLAPIAMDLF